MPLRRWSDVGPSGRRERYRQTSHGNALTSHGRALGVGVGIGIAVEVGVDPDADSDTDPEEGGTEGAQGMLDDDLRGLCASARNMGAVDARVIDPASVATATWVRLKCQYGCNGYGRRLTCPPYSPDPATTRTMLSEYSHAILVHARGGTDVKEVVVALEREAFLAGYYKAFAMGAGPCRLCPECDVTSPCVNNDRARPCMEASGIDVFQTARTNGFEIDVLTSRECTGNHYGLVLVC